MTSNRERLPSFSELVAGLPPSAQEGREGGTATYVQNTTIREGYMPSTRIGNQAIHGSNQPGLRPDPRTRSVQRAPTIGEHRETRSAFPNTTTFPTAVAAIAGNLDSSSHTHTRAEDQEQYVNTFAPHAPRVNDAWRSWCMIACSSTAAGEGKFSGHEDWTLETRYSFLRECPAVESFGKGWVVCKMCGAGARSILLGAWRDKGTRWGLRYFFAHLYEAHGVGREGVERWVESVWEGEV